MASKLYTVICKCLYKGGVLPAEVDECLKWAFGPRALKIPPGCDPLHWEENWIDNWNHVHGKLMHIDRHDGLAKTLYCVGMLFCSQKDKTYEMQRMRREKSN